MGIFDMAIAIPAVQYFGELIIIAVCVTYLFVRVFWQDKRYCPERKMFITARQKGLPLIQLTDLGSRNSVWELGTKKSANNIKFESKFAGSRIDPVYTATGCEPLRFSGGLDIYQYAFESYLPQTVTNHLAYRSIVQFFHEKCADLQFLTEMEFIALISTPEMFLLHDAEVYIGKYFKSEFVVKDGKEVTGPDGNPVVKRYRQFQAIDERQQIQMTDGQETIRIPDESSPTGYSEIPNPNFGNPITVSNPDFNKLVWFEQEIDAQTMHNRIEECKRVIQSLPLVQGYYAGIEAFQHNANAYSAQDLDQLLLIQEKEMTAEMMKKMNMMVYAIAALIIMIGGGIAFYIVQIAMSNTKT